ncbi:RidA family protein [Egibacter rhizosphaerae]|uniref:RidA family protein n=1 Tax=Egibacter rhizosphaerae TaxID=1670831 RepID=A0A411YGM7_9ACTN|nr:RidA family protein [Egibacter rhizosphaerae]QBI20400.1 RidA family protein [Egibacter rhizosphaerae]
MEREQIDPWMWQEPYGFSHAWRVRGADEIVFVSGQASVDADGQVQHPDDVAAQTRLTYENLQTVLARSGASLQDVVKQTVYLVGTEHLGEFGQVAAEFLQGHRPAQTVVGCEALALPGMRVEVEVIAVR